MGSVVVTGPPRSGVLPLTAAAGALGVPTPIPADLAPPTPGDPLSGGECLTLAAIDDDVLRAAGGSWKAPPLLDEAALAGAALGALRARAAEAVRALLPDGAAWGDHRVCLTLPFWDAVVRCRLPVVPAHRDPARLAAELPVIAGVSEAYALSLWERYVRQVLTWAQGRPVLVARPDDVDVDVLARFLRDHAGAVAATEGALPKPFEDAAPAATVELSPEQRELLDVLDGLVGAHDALAVPPLPPETPWTALLLDERRRAEEERGRLVVALDAAVGAVAGLTAPAPARRAVSLEPRYGKDAAEDARAYRVWLDRSEPRRVVERHRVADRVNARPDAPVISVAVPVYRPDPDLLRRCVRSVACQVYGRWELALCDDGSGDPAVTALLEELAATDARIKWTRLDANQGIAAATNAAVAVSTGEFVGFLDQDDELEPGTLAFVADTVLDQPDVDLLYTDEDKLDEAGLRAEPFFKPDWSPDQLLSQMYVGHFTAVRRSVFDEVGGLRPEYDGSQDFDLALRVSERARRIMHVPEVLYHWRRTAGSTAQDYGAKPQADVAARRALEDALARRGEEGTVEPGLVPGTFRVRRRLREDPLVSIVVPFRDGADLLARCVESLHATAGYDRWEALLIDNQSWEPETAALLQRLETDPKCRLLSYPRDFNWSAINNFGARHAEGDVLLLLNSDIEGKEHGWLEAMVEHVQRPEVGAVGARLLYPDGRIQHAGVVMGLGGVAWHSFCFCPGDKPGYFSQAKLVRNYLAVTGACLMVRRNVYDEVGGIDERLAVAFSDIDLCLKVHERGYSVVYTPFAELVHYEGYTRGVSSRELAETRLMMQRWERYIRRDPYFNPNLDARRSEHAVPAGDEEATTWDRLCSMLEIS